MENPVVPLPNGRYQLAWLNGAPNYDMSIILTINGDKWSLDKSHTLYEVTHLPCRSAVYKGCSPKGIDMNDFPVKPGAVMPAVTGCKKTDYAVLFITGLEKQDTAVVEG